MARIVFTCFGSLGDLYPYVAVARELQQRGHDVAIASSTIFQQHIEAQGVAFMHLRSRLDRYDSPAAVRTFMHRVFDPLKGGEFITRELLADIDATYADTERAVANADLVISNPMAYCTPITCRERRIPWLSSVLAPMFFLSVDEPPLMAAAPWLRKIYHFSPAAYRGLFALLKAASKPWVKPLYRLCEQRKLAPPTGHPLFDGQYSPYGTLAMFPSLFADAQRDWPMNTVMTGFPRHAAEMAARVELEAMQAFIEAGEAPIVFALGSSAVNIAGDFYAVSADIARQLKRRAVLVYGEHADQVEAIEPDENLFLINYVAYEKLFPHACLIVHQGGIGTLAQSLAARCPVLVVPFGFDQFDNGERVEKLGVGKCLDRRLYKSENVVPLLREMLQQPSYLERASSIGEAVANDDGTVRASDMIERILRERG